MKLDILVNDTYASLREANYSEHTIVGFRGVVNNVEKFMQEHGYSEYTPEIGQEALLVFQSYDVGFSRKKVYKEMIAHLDRQFACIPFEVPRGKRKRLPITRYPEFEQYIDWCEFKNLERGTLNNYRDICKTISDGFEILHLKSISELSAKCIIEFCGSLSKYKRGHKHNIIFVLKNSLHFFYIKGIINKDFSEIVPDVRYDHKSKIPSIYTEEEISDILAVSGNEKPIEKRNYAMILLTAHTGLRSSDVTGLRFQDIDWENDKIGIVMKKTKVSLFLPLYPEVGNAIIDYIINGRPMSESDVIFVTHVPPYVPMHSTTFSNIVYQAIEKAGIDKNGRKAGANILRHSLASKMLAEGKSLKTISDQFGHQSVQTTTIYAKVDTKSLGQCALDAPAYQKFGNFVIDNTLGFPIVGDLAHDIADYIRYKQSMGNKAENEIKYLKNLAKFSLSYDLSQSLLPEEMVTEWLNHYNTAKSITLAQRRRVLRGFALYLHNTDHENIFIPEFPMVNGPKSDFKPYIFSDDELCAFFASADTLPMDMRSLIFGRPHFLPTLFRILLCCGLRLGEALVIKVNDIDFKAQTIRLLVTKNDKERLIVADTSLLKCIKEYIVMNELCDDQYLFIQNNGKIMSEDTAYAWFRKILRNAGIEHKGKGYGPRIHDFRHTFAVRSLNKMLSEGKSLYAALPVLMEYLGHSNIRVTEQYIHLVEWMFPDIIASMDEISSKIIPEMEATT